jgi:hypothetical protein
MRGRWQECRKCLKLADKERRASYKCDIPYMLGLHFILLEKDN